MLKETIKYEDFNGDMRSEDLYFNLTKTEMVDLEMARQGALSERLDAIKKSNNAREAYWEFKDIVLFCYGKKSEDGRKFLKTEEIREDFRSSAAWDEFFFQMMSDAAKAANFVNAVVPAKQLEEAMKDAEANREKNKRVLEDLEKEPQMFRTPIQREEPKEEKGTFGQPLEKEKPKKEDPSEEEMRALLKENGLL